MGNKLNWGAALSALGRGMYGVGQQKSRQKFIEEERRLREKQRLLEIGLRDENARARQEERDAADLAALDREDPWYTGPEFLGTGQGAPRMRESKARQLTRDQKGDLHRAFMEEQSAERTRMAGLSLESLIGDRAADNDRQLLQALQPDAPTLAPQWQVADAVEGALGTKHTYNTGSRKNPKPTTLFSGGDAANPELFQDFPQLYGSTAAAAADSARSGPISTDTPVNAMLDVIDRDNLMFQGPGEWGRPEAGGDYRNTTGPGNWFRDEMSPSDFVMKFIVPKATDAGGDRRIGRTLLKKSVEDLTDMTFEEFLEAEKDNLPIWLKTDADKFE